MLLAGGRPGSRAGGGGAAGSRARGAPMTESSPRPAAPYGDFQLEIYLAGLGGTVPDLPVSFADLEARAAHALPPSVLSYVAGGAGDEQTQRANAAAFGQWGLMPR